jgi:hypothetical protein
VATPNGVLDPIGPRIESSAVAGSEQATAQKATHHTRLWRQSDRSQWPPPRRPPRHAASQSRIRP